MVAHWRRVAYRRAEELRDPLVPPFPVRVVRHGGCYTRVASLSMSDHITGSVQYPECVPTGGGG